MVRIVDETFIRRNKANVLRLLSGHAFSNGNAQFLIPFVRLEEGGVKLDMSRCSMVPAGVDVDRWRNSLFYSTVTLVKASNFHVLMNLDDDCECVTWADPSYPGTVLVLGTSEDKVKKVEAAIRALDGEEEPLFCEHPTLFRDDMDTIGLLTKTLTSTFSATSWDGTLFL